MIVPVAIAVAQAAGVRPVEPALGATLGASMGFMMPISTAPNAIVYSSGFIPITAMMRYGIALDVVAFVLIVAAVTLAGRCCSDGSGSASDARHCANTHASDLRCHQSRRRRNS